jgi:YD repeat-containing protein
VWRFTFSSWDANGNPYFIVGAPASQTAQLTETVLQAQPNWTLAFQNGEKRVFDYFSGKLLSITDRNGNTTQLTYDASYRLVKVTDPASRHLYFSYGSPLSIYGGELGILTYYLVANVTSDFGVSLSYAYDAAGRLTQVTEPDNTTLSFQFSQINEPSPMLPINSLVVLDSNGKVLESHTYNCNGQGLTSSRAGGVEAVTISYPPCYPLYVAADAGTKR